MSGSVTADEVIRGAAAQLAAAGIVSARVDAELLLAHVWQVGRSDVQRRVLLQERVAEGHAQIFNELIEQRSTRIPQQHLTGHAAFDGHELAVGPGVFVPRFETEVLVDLAARELTKSTSGEPGEQHTDAVPAGRGCEIVDLCTGSGAIAISLARRFPHAQVHAVELDPLAHAWAERNVGTLADSVTLIHGDARSALVELEGLVDLVCCNPPYVPPDAVPVDSEVRDYDPPEALYGGGADGLEIPLQLAQRAGQLLRPGGVLLMEHAEGQGEALLHTLGQSETWAEVTDYPDLSGRPRVLRARLRR